MKTQLKATNATEAKLITDNYLKWLSPKRCVKMFNGCATELGILAFNKSYQIGASAFYYGIGCKHFCSDIIRLHILNGAIAYYKERKELNANYTDKYIDQD